MNLEHFIAGSKLVLTVIIDEWQVMYNDLNNAISYGSLAQRSIVSIQTLSKLHHDPVIISLRTIQLLLLLI